ncbi:MAG: 4-hydroxy-3-methylbut-2-enyl diphosphate reductase [Pseudomonadota bacterium]|nr:4-hydroxy-3-methylbut-2-enyl diphosphate reductase [Pseudomonadota bacterium]
MSEKPKLRVILCSPRGFCAGVTRAIDVVETALKLHGAPVYVRHEIVHNKYVVDSLKAKGAIFIKELSEAPAGAAPVIFSAHGVPKSVPAEAQQRGLNAIDATCPLVTKVHREAQAHFKRGRHIILIGHSGHPEVVGTLGQLPAGAITLVGDRAEVERLDVPAGKELAFVTQTTLSVDDTRDVIAALKAKFPAIQEPPVEDICYATTNRQEAVKAAASQVDAVIVVGAENSSNSQRLREVAEREGCKVSLLAPNVAGLDFAALEGARSLAITAGASAPEILVEQILDGLAERYTLEVETLTTREENMFFPLPRVLREPAPAAD